MALTSATRLLVEPDGALILAFAASAGALASVAPLEAGVATAIALVVYARAGPPRWTPPGRRRARMRAIIAVCAAAAFFVGAWRAARAIATHENARTAVVEAGVWPARCAVEGTIARSPVRLGD